MRIFELLCVQGTYVRVFRRMLQHVTKVAVIDAVLVLVVCTCIHVYSSDLKLIMCVAKIQNM